MNMTQTTLKIGMPAGSLADPSRGGNLTHFLENSGFKTAGYDAGGPTRFPTNSFLFGWDGRPQEFSSQLAIGELDVAIAGDDWIRERILEFRWEYNTEIRLERVLPLQRGSVKIVCIADGENQSADAGTFLSELVQKKELLVVASEMPYLSLEWVYSRLGALGCREKFGHFSVQKYKTPSKIQSGILVYETWGKTEAKVKNRGVDFGVEITQSGSAIKNYGLRILETIMESQTAIWIRPEIRENPEQRELLQMFLLNLVGTINAERKALIVFNVPHTAIAEVELYLSQNKLFADEPTISAGKAYSVYNIQVDTAEGNVPLAKIRYDLAKLGAKNIDTLPIKSSIPSLDVIL